MTIVRAAFADLLARTANKVYVDEYNMLPSEYDQFFNIETSGKAYEDELVMTGLGVAVEKPEGEPIFFDRPKMRGSVRFIHAGYGLGYEITRESVEDDQYQALNSKGATNLALSMRECEELTAAAIFNLAFSTVQAYDGVALISASHPDAVGGTQSNVSAADISVAALKAAFENFTSLTTDRGMHISLMPTMLVIPPGNWWTVQEILGAPYLSSGSQGTYTPNVTGQMGLTPYMYTHLTDHDSWYLMLKHPMGAKFYWRRKPDPTSGDDLRAQIAWYGITARFSAGVIDWRWIYGSPGAGS